VEAALHSVPGVRAVIVSFDDQLARVSVDRGTEVAALRTAIEEAGFRTWTKDEAGGVGPRATP
jgi:copper chaperone CopZ